MLATAVPASGKTVCEELHAHLNSIDPHFQFTYEVERTEPFEVKDAPCAGSHRAPSSREASSGVVRVPPPISAPMCCGAGL